MGVIWRFFKNAWARPGAAALATLALWAGAIGLFNVGQTTDILRGLLPEYAVQIMNTGFALAGLSMLAGMGTHRANIEAFGWALLSTGAAARGVALLYLVGLTGSVVGTLVLYAAIIISSIVRFHQIWRGEIIVVLHSTNLAPKDES